MSIYGTNLLHIFIINFNDEAKICIKFALLQRLCGSAAKSATVDFYTFAYFALESAANLQQIRNDIHTIWCRFAAADLLAETLQILCTSLYTITLMA